MPEQKPGRSKQDYATPREFIAAVERRWGPLALDLAAHTDNHVTEKWYGPGGLAEDSLVVDWSALRGNLWLNPPYGHIEPWAEKCHRTVIAWHEMPDAAAWQSRIFFLVPASVGANWYAKNVFEKSRSVFLNGRLSFDGKNPFPKDCGLFIFGVGMKGFECWRWGSYAIEDIARETHG